jgi:hypothetical protein
VENKASARSQSSDPDRTPRTVSHAIWEKAALNVAPTCGALGNNSLVPLSGELIDATSIAVAIGSSKDAHLVAMNVRAMDSSMGTIMLTELSLALRSAAT